MASSMTATRLSPEDWGSLVTALKAVTPMSLDSDLANADGYLRMFAWRYLFPAMEELADGRYSSTATGTDA